MRPIDPTMPVRPDGHYGLSKAFGENLARFYFDRYGIESVCLRIGSSFPEPKDRRMLATWLSYDDLERLVLASLTAPVVGHSVVYGLSDRFFGQYVDNIQAVTSPAVQKAAETYIQPKRFAVVVVGDRKVIEAGIRALNLGPVRVMSVDEAVGQ